MVLINNAWEFCTNGYPDPDALAAYLRLVIQNAEAGARYYGYSATGRGFSKLRTDARAELEMMGAAP